MKTGVVVLASDAAQSETLCAMVAKANFHPIPAIDAKDAHEQIERSHSRALIMDLDTVSATNVMLRDLKKPSGITIIAVSERPIHPELAESMRTHIFACLSKPVDGDELEYLLKSVFEE